MDIPLPDFEPRLQRRYQQIEQWKQTSAAALAKRLPVTAMDCVE